MIAFIEDHKVAHGVDGLERALIIFKCTWAHKAREYIIGIRGWSEIEASLYPV